MNVVAVLMVHCSIMIGSMIEGCTRCNQTWGRQTEKEEKEFMGHYYWRWKNLLYGCPSELKQSVTTAVLFLFKFNTERQEKNMALLTSDPTDYSHYQQQQLPCSHSHVVYFTNRYSSWISRRYQLHTGHGGTAGRSQGQDWPPPLYL